MKNIELDKLREEIAVNKKFIVERPFIIIVSGVAGFNFIGEQTIWIVPFFIISLIYFITWFNSNRQKSSCRIIGYISQFLETEMEYFGWENYLTLYRDKQIQSKIGIKEINIQALKIAEKQEHRLGFFKAINYYYILIAAVFLGFSYLIFFTAFFHLENTITDAPEKISILLSTTFMVLSSISFIFLIWRIKQDYYLNESIAFEKEIIIAKKIRELIINENLIEKRIWEFEKLNAK